jgi:quinol monooxygenase YgiN
MPIYQIATYQVSANALDDVRAAIEEFVAYVRDNEPGTTMYAAWQEHDDPTKFAHLFIFADDKAHTAHGESPAVRRFEDVYRPVLAAGPVVFTDYHLVADNRREQR